MMFMVFKSISTVSTFVYWYHSYIMKLLKQNISYNLFMLVTYIILYAKNCIITVLISDTFWCWNGLQNEYVSREFLCVIYSEQWLSDSIEIIVQIWANLIIFMFKMATVKLPHRNYPHSKQCTPLEATPSKLPTLLKLPSSKLPPSWSYTPWSHPSPWSYPSKLPP